MPFAVPAVPPQILRVFVNPGHGLNNAHPYQFDSGAISAFGQEHEIAASVCDRTSNVYFLGRDDNAGPAFDVTVLETPSCTERCVRERHPGFSHLSYVVRWLNDVTKPFDYILSIHLNFDECADTSGVEVYYSKHAPEKRQIQAAAVARAVATSLGIPDRGAYRSDQSQHSSLAILDDTDAPALLIEMGFISNKQDVDAVKQCGPDAIISAIKSLRGEK